MSWDTMENHFVSCACEHDQHVLRYNYFETDDRDEPGDFDEFYTSVNLHHHDGFFRRCWLALKYVFGYTAPSDGHFCCTLFTPERALALRAFIDKYLENKGVGLE